MVAKGAKLLYRNTVGAWIMLFDYSNNVVGDPGVVQHEHFNNIRKCSDVCRKNLLFLQTCEGESGWCVVVKLKID